MVQFQEEHVRGFIRVLSRKAGAAPTLTDRMALFARVDAYQHVLIIHGLEPVTDIFTDSADGAPGEPPPSPGDFFVPEAGR